MNRSEVDRNVRAIIAARIEGEPDPTTLRADVPIFRGGLGLDSVAAIELLLEIESRFALQINDDAFDIFDSLDRLVDYVSEHQNTAADRAGGAAAGE
jgi:acyl carrier protein